MDPYSGLYPQCFGNPVGTTNKTLAPFDTADLGLTGRVLLRQREVEAP